MIRSFFNRLAGNRILQHLTFWLLAFYVLLRIFSGSGELLKIDIYYTLIFILTLLPGIYLNLLILIPGLLSHGRYILYILLIMISMVLTAGFNIFTFSVLIDYIFPGYYFISYYDFIDLMKFVITLTTITTLLKFSKGWFLLMETRNKISMLEKENAETKLLALKSQINPHFLFNSLTGIYALVIKQAVNAPEVILRLSHFLRYILYEATGTSVGLSNVLEAMKDYIELQKLRAGKQATITFEMDGDPGNYQIVPLLFLPLIENSFKHGIKGETGASFASFFFKIGTGTITGNFSNNKGKSEELSGSSYKGIGLNNLKNRLEMIFPGKYLFTVDETESTFDVNLTIPLDE